MHSFSSLPSIPHSFTLFFVRFHSIQHLHVHLYYPKKKKKNKNKNKKQKEKEEFLPNAKEPSQKKLFSDQLQQLSLIRVRPVLTHEQCNYRTQFLGNKMQNYVLYPTPLIAIKILDKEGAVVDTVFCPPSICLPDPKNSKNINFSSWGCGHTQIDMAQFVWASEHLKCHFRSN